MRHWKSLPRISSEHFSMNPPVRTGMKIQSPASCTCRRTTAASNRLEGSIIEQAYDRRVMAAGGDENQRVPNRIVIFQATPMVDRDAAGVQKSPTQKEHNRRPWQGGKQLVGHWKKAPAQHQVHSDRGRFVTPRTCKLETDAHSRRRWIRWSRRSSALLIGRRPRP